MQIKGVIAREILDSRGEKTIEISIGRQKTSAPAGKSTGKHERISYKSNLAHDINFINKLNFSSLSEIKRFQDLELLEKIVGKEVGANTLFVLEATILKVLAKENKKELWAIVSEATGRTKIPLLISNTIGGGVHSSGKKRPDFQEFLVIGKANKNFHAYKEAGAIIKASKTNDEHAWQTPIGNESVLEVMRFAKMRIGIDAAASQFFKEGKYFYKNPQAIKSRGEQIDYIKSIIEDYGIDYLEDPLDEDDFEGFAKLVEFAENKCLIVGDDLTVTNFGRVKKAIAMKAVTGVIIKPNQTGSLVEVKEVVDLCKKNKIKTIMSHRSGETMDDTIADLAVGFGCDYIKIPIVGKERLVKVKRLKHIARQF